VWSAGYRTDSEPSPTTAAAPSPLPRQPLRAASAPRRRCRASRSADAAPRPARRVGDAARHIHEAGSLPIDMSMKLVDCALGWGRWGWGSGGGWGLGGEEWLGRAVGMRWRRWVTVQTGWGAWRCASMCRASIASSTTLRSRRPAVAAAAPPRFASPDPPPTSPLGDGCPAAGAGLSHQACSSRYSECNSSNIPGSTRT
jgi:hypothetical protein